jgi:predicted nucleotide-binding protein
MLNSFPQERVGIQKSSGASWNDIPAIVQSGLIVVLSTSIPLEEGDLITRQLPGGVEERFVVEDRGYQAAAFGMPAHFQAKVRRAAVEDLDSPTPISSTQNRSVFVVHGRDLTARDALFEFLRAIGLRPIEWSQAVDLTAKPSPSIPEVLERAFAEAAAVVVLLTGDDEAYLAPRLRNPGESHYETTLTPQPRANVLFEAGMAFGIHYNRTVLVQFGELRPFSDIAGRYVIRLTNDTAKRQELAQRLKAAGCPVDLTGTDWHKAGDFRSPNSAPLPHASFAVAPAHNGILSPAGTPALATNVEVGDPTRLDASGFSCRFYKRSGPYWHLTWKLNVFNKTRGDSAYRIRLNFADEEGFVLDHTIEQPETLIAPNQQKTLSGSYLLAAEIAQRVSQVTAHVSRS